MHKLTEAGVEAWIMNLRSGVWEQGKHYLKNAQDNCLCALGLLLETIDPEAWEKRPCEHRPAIIEWHHPLRRNEWSQFVKDQLIRGKVQRQIASMNDAGKSFNEIADYIEETLLKSLRNPSQDASKLPPGNSPGSPTGGTPSAAREASYTFEEPARAAA